MSGVPQWLEYTVLGVVVLVVVIARQLQERELTSRRIVVLPLVFVVLAFMTDHQLLHRLASVGALGLLVLGLVLAVATGTARAMTMRVRRVGGTVLTKGNGRTLALWFVTLALRVGEGALAYALGIQQGAGEAMLFAAATFATQGAVLAWRAGLFANVSGAGSVAGAGAGSVAGSPVEAPVRESAG
jgi:membrane protein CcdC involved in cytochrome C biogenesis